METSCDKNSPKMSSVNQKVFTIVIRLLFFRFRIFFLSPYMVIARSKCRFPTMEFRYVLKLTRKPVGDAGNSFKPILGEISDFVCHHVRKILNHNHKRTGVSSGVSLIRKLCRDEFLTKFYPKYYSLM